MLFLTESCRQEEASDELVRRGGPTYLFTQVTGVRVRDQEQSRWLNGGEHPA